MLAIVRIVNGAPEGWIIATDIDDATRKAHSAGHQGIADMLYRMPPEGIGTSPAKQELVPGTWLLRY